jgi:hypothetical protein
VYAETIDAGPYVGFLRQFGPPEVVELDAILGNGNVSEEASGFWEVVEAVTFKIVTDATVATRLPRLRWFAGEAVPFAQAQTSLGTAATKTSVYTFTTDINEAGVASGATLLVPIPRLLFLPKWSVEIDVPGGVAGDHVTNVRVYRKRYQLVELEAV